MKTLITRQVILLRAMSRGARLRDHRDIDGHKWHDLQFGDATAMSIQSLDVAALIEAGLIDSNKKFPAATYWISAEGERWLGRNPAL